MKYYKVKEKYGDYPILIKINKTVSVLIANELFTEKERAKFIAPDCYFDIVNIPQGHTFRMCGVRFQYHEN